LVVVVFFFVDEFVVFFVFGNALDEKFKRERKRK